MTSFLWRLFLLAAVPALAEEPLQLDDECVGESCSFNALQLRGVVKNDAVPVVPDMDDIFQDPDDEEEEEESTTTTEKPEKPGMPEDEEPEKEEPEDAEDEVNPDEATPAPIHPVWEPLPEDANCAEPDTQCGGPDYYGPTCCWHAHTCYKVNEYFSMCVTEAEAEERENGPTTTSTTTTTNSDPQGCLVGYQQCGGWDEVNKKNYSGPTCCHAGFVCVKVGTFFSQCTPTEKDGPFMPYKPTKALEEPSNATELTFYVYRASSEEGDQYLDNINVGNLAGTLWYIHNEVVFERPRKFNISKLIRYKIHTKATTPLWELGMNFGARFAYDSAQCAGPWSCDLNYERLGYFVGCNNLGMFPFPRYDTSYPEAKWYALPGPCESKPFGEKDPICDKEQPGGRCEGKPTGQGNCTYSIEIMGSVTLDEIAGIKDYHKFIHTGGVEFNKTLDQGIGNSFWDKMNVTIYNQDRINKVQALFEAKYPDQPTDEEMAAPPCDFNFKAFYGVAEEDITTLPPATTTAEQSTGESGESSGQSSGGSTTTGTTMSFWFWKPDPTTTTEATTTEKETTEAATTEATTTEAETTEAETTEAETTEAATTEAESSTEAEVRMASTTEAKTKVTTEATIETTTEAATTATTTPKGCKDAEFGTHCYRVVAWAKEKGLKQHPKWYPGLTSSSPFSDFQARVHHANPKDCPLPCTKNSGCHTAVKGESCYSAVNWAKKSGIKQHPTWYKGLTKESSFYDFQVAVHKATPKKCPMPCEPEA